MVEEFAISKTLPFDVADKAVDLLVHQAGWVAHEMLFGEELTVLAWYPEHGGGGCVEIHASISGKPEVVAVAERTSEFWVAVRAVQNDPILRGRDE